MTLDKWLSKTAAERNRLRRQWIPGPTSKPWRIRSELLIEACQRFKREFGNHPLIVRVAGGSRGYEPCIEVFTSLWSLQQIEELPDRYCTFRVVQESQLSRKAERLKYWTLVLQHIPGWSKSKIRSWSGQFMDRLNGQSDLTEVFYHYFAASYVIPALMPQHFVKKFRGTTKYWELRNQLWKALEPPQRGNRVYPTPLDSHYDWDAARKRVRKVLSKYKERSK